MVIQTLPLNAQAFRPFGQVHAAVRLQTQRVETSWFPEDRDHDRPLNIAYGAKAPSSFPLRIGHLERHRLSSQLFMPIDLSRLLVVVCHSSAEGTPDLSTLTAFAAGPSQAVQYGKGVWHAPLHLADRNGTYLAVRYCRAIDDDLDLFILPHEVTIAID